MPWKSAATSAAHPEEIRMTELACEAPAIAGFEVNAGGGDDTVIFTATSRSR